MARFFVCMVAVVLLAACGPSRFITPPLLPTLTSLPPDQPVDNSADIFMPAYEIPYLPQGTDSALKRDTAAIESKQILTLEMFPPQYTLVLKGTLPTICHQLRVKVSEPNSKNIITMDVYSVTDPNKACALVVAPFEVNIGLNGFAAGTHSILVNGEAAGEIKIASAIESHSMKGFELYSWQSDGV